MKLLVLTRELVLDVVGTAVGSAFVAALHDLLREIGVTLGRLAANR